MIWLRSIRLGTLGHRRSWAARALGGRAGGGGTRASSWCRLRLGCDLRLGRRGTRGRLGCGSGLLGRLRPGLRLGVGFRFRLMGGGWGLIRGGFSDRRRSGRFLRNGRRDWCQRRPGDRLRGWRCRIRWATGARLGAVPLWTPRAHAARLARGVEQLGGEGLLGPALRRHRPAALQDRADLLEHALGAAARLDLHEVAAADVMASGLHPDGIEAQDRPPVAAPQVAFAPHLPQGEPRHQRGIAGEGHESPPGFAGGPRLRVHVRTWRGPPTRRGGRAPRRGPHRGRGS